MSTIEVQTRKDLRHNLTASMLDASFFGIGWGLSSFGTIIPLFISQLTTSAILIGLIPAIHAVGWQLPQLFTAGAVSRLRRYKPMVMLMTIQERIPFLGLGLVALLLPQMSKELALVLAYLLLIWQGLGSGMTANPWQSMVAKIIPAEYRGTFFGMQAAVANTLISISAIGAGYLLNLINSPLDFAVCFFAAAVAYAISMGFLSLTREPEDTEKQIPAETPSTFNGMGEILRNDRNFFWFLVMRIFYQFASMGFSFYIVYALRQFQMDDVTAGYLTATLTIAQTIANAGMGFLSDRIGHRTILIIGMFAVSLSSVIAWMAPELSWFYPVFIICGLANVAYWTIGMAMTVEFGNEKNRPVYIGMSNTLVAPATILAPIVGGWIADNMGYSTTFMISTIGGLITAAILIFLIQDPKKKRVNAQ